jgi:hypothetical protein
VPRHYPEILVAAYKITWHHSPERQSSLRRPQISKSVIFISKFSSSKQLAHKVHCRFHFDKLVQSLFEIYSVRIFKENN